MLNFVTLELVKLWSVKESIAASPAIQWFNGFYLHYTFSDLLHTIAHLSDVYIRDELHQEELSAFSYTTINLLQNKLCVDSQLGGLWGEEDS